MPMQEIARITVRDRLALLGEIRSAGVPLVAVLTVLQLAVHLMPAAMAVATARLVRTAALPAQHPLLATVTVVVGFYGAVLACGHVLDAAAAPLRYAVKARVDGVRRAEIVQLVAACPTLDRLERPEVTTMWSASEDLPAISMATVSSAFASSRLCSTMSIIWIWGAGAALAAVLRGEAAIKRWPLPMRKHESSVA